ncbi:sulfotransferase 1 family member D1-like [Ciona intestinalis]
MGALDSIGQLCYLGCIRPTMNKQALAALLAAATDYISEDERPDLSEFIEYFLKEQSDVKINEWRGYRMWMGSSTETTRWAYENWMPWKNDVIIAAYAKTGTTWVRNIVSHLIYRQNPQAMEMYKNLHAFLVYLETGTPVKFEVLDKLPWKRRILATHIPAKLLNMKRIKGSGAKIICPIRNPKDQIVSWYNMAKKLPVPKNHELVKSLYPRTWEEFIEVYTQGQQPLASKVGEWYPDYLLSWYQHKEDENVLFVVYEDMKKDPVKEIQKIADFLDIPISESDLDEVVHETSFSTMRRQSAQIEKKLDFYRKGEVGDWKNHLTVAQSEMIDAKIQEKLGHTDLKFTYEP